MGINWEHLGQVPDGFESHLQEGLVCCLSCDYARHFISV